MTSEASLRAAALVGERRPRAEALGAALAELIGEPDAFVATLTAGLHELADAEYAIVQERAAPGSGATIGVRWPLLHAMEARLRRPLRETSSSVVLDLAGRLAAAPSREVRLVSLPCLARTLPEEPELSWQLLRRLARGASDWISVDSLAGVYAQGVRAERFRWAELEQLVYSDHRMERRLVGSTLANLPHGLPATRRATLDAGPTLTLIESLMGDADDHVQKSLSWALREWSRVDQPAVERFLRQETGIAVATRGGHRAWVIRDALSHQPEAVGRQLREQLAGIRKRSGAPSTSRAAEVAAAFGVSALADAAVSEQGRRYAGARA